MQRPPPQRLGSVSARVIRGPRADGRWYWRAEWTRSVGEGASRSLWSGWATEPEVQVEVARLLAGGQDRPRQVEEALAWSGLRTVDELLRAYLYHCEHERPDLRQETLSGYRRNVKAWRTCGSQELLIARLSAAVLDQARARLLQRYAPVSARMLLIFLGGAWTWARGRGYVPDTELHLPEVVVPRREQPRLTQDEGIALAEAQTVPWRRVAILLMATLGCRRGEVASLTWDRVDLQRGWMVLKGKTGPRRVPLTRRLVEELSALPRTGDLVLGVTPLSARRGLQVALAGHGTHALRRGAVDRLARDGVDVGTAAALLGHSPTVMLRTYRRVTEDDLRAAVEDPPGVIRLDRRRR